MVIDRPPFPLLHLLDPAGSQRLQQTVAIWQHGNPPSAEVQESSTGKSWATPPRSLAARILGEKPPNGRSRIHRREKPWVRQPTPLVAKPVGPPLALSLRCPSIHISDRPMAAVRIFLRLQALSLRQTCPPTPPPIQLKPQIPLDVRKSTGRKGAVNRPCPKLARTSWFSG